jgi:aminopeptidase N
MLRSFASLAGLALVGFARCPSLTAQAARPTGQVGAYTAPRMWPLRQHGFDLLHQRIELAFDMGRRLLTGVVTTRLVLTTGGADTVALDAGHLSIDDALDSRGKRLPFRFDSSRVVVRLPHRAPAGDTVQFTLRYHTKPERGIYFVPRRRIIWSQGEATETRNWVPTYDAANDKTTWEFLITADTGLQVLSNGRLADVRPAPDASHRIWHWVQEQAASTYLYSVVVGRLTVLHDQWRTVPVDYWVDPDTTAAAWRTFGETPSMIEIYSRVLGVNYPWAKYDQAVIPDFTYGGMENVSATTQTDLALHPADAEPDFGGRGLVAHELAHQWFGDLITAADWAHIWLNEGLTTYMESVHEEKSRGWDAAQLNWWQQQQQAMQADSTPRPLVWGKYQGDDPIVLFFSGHVYPKGAQLAHQLRRLLGDSLFWAGMHRFLVDNAYKPVTTEDFAAAFERTTGRDLDWFFDQWAYGVGFPQVRVSRAWDVAGKVLTVTVEQTQPVDSLRPVFRFPVTIRVTTRDSIVRREIMVSKTKESFPLLLPGAPMAFRFDEGGWLLGTVITDQSPQELSDMARHDPEFAARNWALQQIDGSSDSVATATREFVVLNERSPWLRMVALQQLARHPYSGAEALARSALRDPAGQVREAAIQLIAAVDSAGAGPLAEAMYRHDPSLRARIAGLQVYAAAGGAAALPLLAEAADSAGPNALRQAAAQSLGELRDPKAGEPLERMAMPNEPRSLREAALDALAAQGDSARAVTVARRYLEDDDPLFAVAAVKALAKVGGREGQALLRRDQSRERRVTVLTAIRAALSGRS